MPEYETIPVEEGALLQKPQASIRRVIVSRGRRRRRGAVVITKICLRARRRARRGAARVLVGAAAARLSGDPLVADTRPIARSYGHDLDAGPMETLRQGLFNRFAEVADRRRAGTAVSGV